MPPLAKEGKAGEDDLRRAAELITYYARHKHNDWSAEWVRRHAVGVLGSYEGWPEDLVLLCQSHHKNYPDLVKEAFDPRPAGRQAEVVHLRYLACVLRVADILDVDSERTPPVLFHHRDIAPESVVYWWKDHGFWARPDGSTMVVYARPSSAVLEKAVRDTAAWIRTELETCARLAREKPFSHYSARLYEPLPHRWNFPEALLTDVRPRNDAYVYIDGAFRPDTTKLLELFSGIQLYREPLTSVRELLQNAFDAVKEQIALERLEGDPADLKQTEAITALQRVELRFEEREGRSWLICTDSGVGMTRSIIEKYLLVSGNSRRHDILALERRCEAAGFHLGRTGQFGIGVLSFFMLADRVEIRTRRSPARSDAETHGWWFQTEGVGAFGELRKDSQEKRGTTVSLRLRETLGTQEEFLSRLHKYLLETLLRVPCSFKLVVEGAISPCLQIEPGWQPLESRLVEEYLSEIAAPNQGHLQLTDGLIPKFHLKKISLDLREWPSIAERFQSTIQWRKEEGQLPGGLGAYRLAVPFFDLQGGRSALFFDFDPEVRGLARPISIARSALALSLQAGLRSCLHGMNVQCNLASDEPINEIELDYLAEIDWEGSCAGQISVDRSTFSLTVEASQAVDWLKTRGEKLQANILSEVIGDYTSLNAILNPLMPPPSEAWWFVNSPNQPGLRWEKLSLPALSGAFSIASKITHAQIDGKLITVAQPLSVFRGHEASSGWVDWGWWACPTKPILARASPLVILPRYLGQPRKIRERLFLTSQFPPAWGSLAALGTNRAGEPWIWNRDHPFIRVVEAQDLEWFSSYNLRQFSDDPLQARGRSALFLMMALQSLSLEWLHDLAEDYRAGFWQELWDRAEVLPAEIAAWVEPTDGGGYLWILGPQGLSRLQATDPGIQQYVPDPGDEWKLAIENDN